MASWLKTRHKRPVYSLYRFAERCNSVTVHVFWGDNTVAKLIELPDPQLTLIWLLSYYFFPTFSVDQEQHYALMRMHLLYVSRLACDFYHKIPATFSVDCNKIVINLMIFLHPLYKALMKYFWTYTAYHFGKCIMYRDTVSKSPQSCKNPGEDR